MLSQNPRKQEVATLSNVYDKVFSLHSPKCHEINFIKFTKCLTSPLNFILLFFLIEGMNMLLPKFPQVVVSN